MEQSEKNIHFSKIELADIEKINREVIARGDYSLAYRNLARSFETRFEIALLRWRRGGSPVDDMRDALITSEKMLAAIRDWPINDESLNGYGDVWNLVRYISFLLDQSAVLPDDKMAGIRENLRQHDDVALDLHLLNAIEGREWREGVDVLLDRLATKKRQMLAVETYRNYIDLLGSDGNDEKTGDLVTAAEANYRRRARDSFYGGGPIYMGGGPDNPYVVDFVLAAILKRIGWTGETIHKWTW